MGVREHGHVKHNVGEYNNAMCIWGFTVRHPLATMAARCPQPAMIPIHHKGQGVGTDLSMD